MTTHIKDVEYYLRLPYAAEVAPIPEDEGGGFTACIPLLGRWSAVGDGDTAEEAYRNLRAALPSLLADWLARGLAVPEPDGSAGSELLSGKLSLRIPPTLHTQAAQVAAQEGVSVNQLITVALARAVGAKLGV